MAITLATSVATNGALFRSIMVPIHLQVANTYEELRAQLASALPATAKALLVTGRISGTLLGQQLALALGFQAPLLVTDNRLASAEAVAAEAERVGAEVLIGVGGGKVIDVCKYGAHLLNRPFFCVATQIAHDGIASPVAVLRVDGHECGQSLGARMPSGVFVPLFVITKAPPATILAGIGDLLANLSAIADWRLAQVARKEKGDDYAMMVSGTAARAIYAELAGSHFAQLRSEPAFLVTLTEALILSGLAMEIAGSSRPCSGAEHMISHALDELLGGVVSHGLQVGFGSVVTAALRASEREFGSLRALCRRLGIPTCPSDLGLSWDAFQRVMLHAPRTRPNRYTILDQIPMESVFLRALYEVLEGEKERPWTSPDSGLNTRESSS
jgi:glycerol-1-phosphate dehydrogenase [NAD(P)+]